MYSSYLISVALMPALLSSGLLEKPGAIFLRGAPRVPPKEPPFSLGHDPWCFRTGRGKPTQGGATAPTIPQLDPSHVAAKPKTLTASICEWEIFSERDDKKNPARYTN